MKPTFNDTVADPRSEPSGGRRHPVRYEKLILIGTFHTNKSVHAHAGECARRVNRDLSPNDGLDRME